MAAPPARPWAHEGGGRQGHAHSRGVRSRSTSRASSDPSSGCTLYFQAMSGGALTMMLSTLQAGAERGGGGAWSGAEGRGRRRPSDATGSRAGELLQKNAGRPDHRQACSLVLDLDSGIAAARERRPPAPAAPPAAVEPKLDAAVVEQVELKVPPPPQQLPLTLRLGEGLVTAALHDAFPAGQDAVTHVAHKLQGAGGWAAQRNSLPRGLAGGLQAGQAGLAPAIQQRGTRKEEEVPGSLGRSAGQQELAVGPGCPTPHLNPIPPHPHTSPTQPHLLHIIHGRGSVDVVEEEPPHAAVLLAGRDVEVAVTPGLELRVQLRQKVGEVGHNGETRLHRGRG